MVKCVQDVKNRIDRRVIVMKKNQWIVLRYCLAIGPAMAVLAGLLWIQEAGPDAAMASSVQPMGPLVAQSTDTNGGLEVNPEIDTDLKNNAEDVDPGMKNDMGDVDSGMKNDTGDVDPGMKNDTGDVDPGMKDDTGDVDPGLKNDTGDIDTGMGQAN
jgi:hypothetical protein